MDEFEYLTSVYHSKNCLFKFKDGSQMAGVISTFFMETPSVFYLVPSGKLWEFQQYMTTNSNQEMRGIAEPVNLKDILSIQLA